MLSKPFRHGDAPSTGSAASRFFHCLPGDVLRYHAKASTAERDAGCEDLYWRANPRNPFGFDRVSREEWEALGGLAREFEKAPPMANIDDRKGPPTARGNVHPTVKRLALMENLCRLVVPAGGSVGDMCTGSGGTALAAQRLGLSFVGAEMCPEAIEIARARLAWWGARKAIQLTITGEEEPITPKPTRAPRERPTLEPAPAPPDPRQRTLF